MSFVITMYVREGIVMASDSRLTLTRQDKKEKTQVVQLAVGQSDSNYKTFLALNNIGISTYGEAAIEGIPLAGYIESFLQEHLENQNVAPDEVPGLLLDYFRKYDPIPKTQFHVAGYVRTETGLEQFVWVVDVANNTANRVNASGTPGATWGGEADILARLIQPVAVIDNDGNVKQKLPSFPIPWQFFTLQDAIDFCIFALRSTIDAIRFQPRAKTVGGPIDVLVIKPEKAFWVQRKELHGENP